MNIAIIPSWFPSEKVPIAGIFFKEQAFFYAESNPDDQIFILLWNEGQQIGGTLPLYKPVKILRHYFRHKKNKMRIEQAEKNLYIITQPTFGLSRHFMIYENQHIRSLHTAIKAIEKEFGKIDLIHAHVAYPAGYYAVKLSEKIKKPVIINEHMSDFPYVPEVGNDWDKKVCNPLRKATCRLAVSRYLSSRIGSFNIPEPEVLPNIIDEDFFKPKVKVNNIANRKFNFFTLAIISENKGISELLQAIALLPDRNQFCFNIGGDGQLKTEYERTANELGISDTVVWLGALNRYEVKNQMAECDAFILASRGETFGVVYVEALASGKPIIATRCGGPEDIVCKDVGILVPVKDHVQLASAITTLKNEYNCYSVEKIRNYFMANFSKQAVIPRLKNIYISTIQKNNSGL